VQAVVSPLSALNGMRSLLVENHPSPRNSPMPEKIIPMPLVADTTAPTLVVSTGSGSLHTPVLTWWKKRSVP
jgi:hypothetical protein